MAINKLRELGNGSFGVTLPKDDLRLVLGEDPEEIDEQNFVVDRKGEDGFEIKKL